MKLIEAMKRVDRSKENSFWATQATGLVSMAFFPVELSSEKLAFKDGHMRMIQRHQYTPVGRIG